jgi:eukaryotic-like serine/threonine-protein kinase
MYCPHCGNPVNKGADFCGHCGKPLAAAESLSPRLGLGRWLIALISVVLIVGGAIGLWFSLRPNEELAAIDTENAEANDAGMEGETPSLSASTPTLPATGVAVVSAAVATPNATATELANTPTLEPTSTPALPAAIPTVTASPTAGVVTRIAPADGMVQVFIPAGEFLMGSDAGDPLADEDERPQRPVYLDAFWMDQTEVTNAMYAICVDEGLCSPPTDVKSNSRDVYYGNPAFANYPVIFVDREAAETYCAWAGRRLPTEAEWEKAARGDGGPIYPWGDFLGSDLANYCDQNCTYNWRDPTINDGQREVGPVGAYPAGASPYGILDMAGNVYEWVVDRYAADYYGRGFDSNPAGPTAGSEAMLRGGSWYDIDRFIRSANRLSIRPTTTADNIGIRCAQDI